MVTDRFQDEVKEYLKPFEGNFNYRNMLHGHIDNTRFYGIVEEIAEHSAIAGITVLSSGCGSGGDLQVFLEAGAALAHGIEISAELAHLARQRFQGTQFEHRVLVDVYDGSNLPYCDNCFDVVLSMHVIEHTQDPRRYLIELFRVLKPRGVIFLELPNWYYWREQHTLLPFIHYPPVKQRDALIKLLVSEPLVRLWSEQTVYKLRTLVGFRIPMPAEVLQQIWAHRADFGLELKDAYFCAPGFGNIPYERLSWKNLNHYVLFMTTFRVVVGKDGTGRGSQVSPSHPQRRVLLISNSSIGRYMSGPGIRYWELARVLSACRDLEVTLTTVPGVTIQLPEDDTPVHLRAASNEAKLCALANEVDVVIAPGTVVSLYPSLGRVATPLVLDLYIPLLLEELQRTREESTAEQKLFFDRVRRDLAAQALRADFIVCASEKQRDYWLGMLSAIGRINPYTHAEDPTLRRLIDVVPFGLPSQTPLHSRRVLKGVHPGIGTDDKVLLWGGGLWDWLDTPTLLRAMAHLGQHRPDIKLFFMGVKHINPQESQRRGTLETLALADELKLTGRTVFFNDWVAYEERANYLLEADIGVSMHRDHLESRFSFRTRFLDNLWAGLPIIASRGDVLSYEVERQGLGRVVEPGNVDELVAAITELVDTPDLRQSYRHRFQIAAEAFRWERVTLPLVSFCRDPRCAPDRAHLQSLGWAHPGPTPWWGLPRKAWRALKVGGLRGLMRQVNQYRQWWLNRRGKA